MASTGNWRRDGGRRASERLRRHRHRQRKTSRHRGASSPRRACSAAVKKSPSEWRQRRAASVKQRIAAATRSARPPCLRESQRIASTAGAGASSRLYHAALRHMAALSAYLAAHRIRERAMRKNNRGGNGGGINWRSA